MKLAIDIGNTSTTIGLFDNYNLLKKTHVLSIDESIDFFNIIKIYEVKQAIISSVVPNLTKKYDKNADARPTIKAPIKKEGIRGFIFDKISNE